MLRCMSCFCSIRVLLNRWNFRKTVESVGTRGTLLLLLLLLLIIIMMSFSVGCSFFVGGDDLVGIIDCAGDGGRSFFIGYARAGGGRSLVGVLPRDCERHGLHATSGGYG